MPSASTPAHECSAELSQKLSHHQLPETGVASETQFADTLNGSSLGATSLQGLQELRKRKAAVDHTRSAEDGSDYTESRGQAPSIIASDNITNSNINSQTRSISPTSCSIDHHAHHETLRTLPPENLNPHASPTAAASNQAIASPNKRQKVRQLQAEDVHSQSNSGDQETLLDSTTEAHQHALRDRTISGEGTPLAEPQNLDVVRAKSNNSSKGRKVSKSVASKRPVNIAKDRAGRAGNPSKPKSSEKRGRATSNHNIEDAAARIVQNAISGASNKAKGRRGRKPRERTPDGAENERIMPNVIRMADLCKDNRQGKKSTREKSLQERDREQLAKKQQQELEELLNVNDPAELNVLTSTQQGDNAIIEGNSLSADLQKEVVRRVPGTQIVGGEIIISDNQQLNLHEEAAQQREGEQLEGVEENDLSRRINSQSYLKREKLNSWPEELTDLFYDGLRMFGTDFGMISKMFPGRTRRAIKLKFSKEERLNQDRVKEVLLGERIPVDMEKFSEMVGTVFNDPDDHEREMEEDRRKLEEEALAEKVLLEDASKQRVEEAKRELAAASEDFSSKENYTEKTKGRKGKKIAKTGGSKKPGRKKY